MMKNFQVIDGAENCTYNIYAATPEKFSAIFPGDGQDIEFWEDLMPRLKEGEYEQLIAPTWKRLLDRKSVSGIHGTLFVEHENKRVFYPTRKEIDFVRNPRRKAKIID